MSNSLSAIENTPFIESEETKTDTNHVPEKTFTQAEVDAIVNNRLARERKRLLGEKTNELNTNKTEAKETELSRRENNLTCREFLIENNLPKELLDVLDTGSFETFKGNIEKLLPLLKTNKSESKQEYIKLNSSPKLTGGDASQGDPLRKAFGLT